MRYRLLGDLLSIKSALLYNRGYVDSVFSRNPSVQMNATKTNQSSHTSFMEYSFKFKIDKGSYSSFNIADYLSDQTMSVLTDDNDSSNIPSNLLMYQLSDSVTERNYTIFEIFDSGSSTEMILNVSKDIQKIEFYDEFINYDDLSKVMEYSFTNPDLTAMTPIMVVEFGPEESYEPEDYYNKDEMPIKPNWDDDSEHSYQLDLEELTNTKFLSISTTSADSEPTLNLSLSAHKSQIDPHRNQEDYVVSNKEFKSTLTEVGNALGKLEYSDIVIDKRSNTILGTTEIDSDLPLLANRNKVNQTEVDGILYDDYVDYVAYRKGYKVHYKGEVFVSLIDGNLGENPYISPMWQNVTTIEEPDIPEDYNQPHTVNVRVNNSDWGTTDPIGPVSVEYGHELYINIITDRANIKSIQVDGISQTIYNEDLFTLSEVMDDHDLLVEFDPIYHNINVLMSNLSEVTEIYGHIDGGGDYLQNTEAKVTAIPYYGYRFIGWYEGEKLISEDPTYTIPKVIEPRNLVALFDRMTYIVSIESNEGGTYEPRDGNPTEIEVYHGDDLEITISPFTGYEVEFVQVDDEIEQWYDEHIYLIENVRSNIKMTIGFSRHQLHVDDPVLGRTNYVIIGDQLWSTADIGDHISKEKDAYYMDFNEMKFIDTVSRDNTGFRVPSKLDWQKLYDYFNEHKAGLNIKSPEITRFNSEGWKSTIYRGLGMYRLDFMPYGYYMRNEDEGFIGRNTESIHWSSNINDTHESVTASALYHDSPIAFFKEIKTDYCKLPIRLMSDVKKINLLGKMYRYVNITIQIDVKVLDDDPFSYNDEYETYQVSQDWLLDNLDFTDLGLRYEESECDKFGSLYNLNEVMEIDGLLQLDPSGFRVPTNLDYIYLEKYLGYGRDQVTVTQDRTEFGVDLDTYINGYIGTNEAKRLKAGDFIYGGIDWKGYETRSLENSQLNVLPSGYAVVEDDEIEFKSMGLKAQFWTASVTESDGSLMSHSRTISYSNDKILRGVDQGAKSYKSIRPVRTTITKL